MTWTRANLKTFVTTLLGGYSLGDTEFDMLMAIAQAKIEGKREWMELRKVDSSISVTASRVFTDLTALPSDFQFLVEDEGVQLASTGDLPEGGFNEVPLGMHFKYQKDWGKFYIDYRQRKIGFCGTAGKTYTAYLTYIYKPTDIDSSNDWVFPNRFTPILAYDIAINYKGGVDYDAISESQARYNQQQFDMLWDAMVDWDSRLQEKVLRGIDRLTSEERVWVGGRVGNN